VKQIKMNEFFGTKLACSFRHKEKCPSLRVQRSNPEPFIVRKSYWIAALAKTALFSALFSCPDGYEPEANSFSM
jgi:hypothetical protein